MISVNEGERERVDAMCRRVDTYIPGEMSFVMWPLPILEKMLDHLAKLEERVQHLEQRTEGEW